MRRVLTALFLLGCGAAFAADEAPTPVERVCLVYLDCSGSMEGPRNQKALALLHESAAEWAKHPATLVIAVPFSNTFAVLAAGEPGALRRLDAKKPLFMRVSHAPGVPSLVDALEKMKCNGGTRLFDTILDTLPLVSAFPEADLTLEVISDGEDNASKHSEAETFGAIEALLKKKIWDNRYCDVYLRRYERVNAGLLAQFQDLAANSGGKLRTFVQELDQGGAIPAAAALELNPTELDLILDPESEALVTPEIRADLTGVNAPVPLSAQLVEANGIVGVTASTAALAPGTNALVLRLDVDDAARPTFWSDCPLLGRVTITAGSASGDVWVSAVLPAGWRVFKTPVVLAALALGALTAIAGFFLLRARARKATMSPVRLAPTRAPAVRVIPARQAVPSAGVRISPAAARRVKPEIRP